MDLKDRYDREHTYGNVTFYLSDCHATPEQSRYLMLKVMEQAVRDYCALPHSELPNERMLWETARMFIYDDEYRIQWGSWELTTEEFLDIIDIDIAWFREQVTKKFKARHGEDNGQSKRKRTNSGRKTTKSNSTSARRDKKRTR